LSYQRLLDEFLLDDVQNHTPALGLINPHFDPLLTKLFESKRQQFDYLHNRDREFTIQFVGSHWWHSDGLYREIDKLFMEGSTCAFDARIARLKLKDEYQFSNCAMGYIPRSKSANMSFTRSQIAYLRPKKFREYQTMGTKIVFALGKTVLDFHLLDTGFRFSRHADAVKHGRITLPCGLSVIPMPHPGALGIMNYLSAMGARNLSVEMQDRTFRDLVTRSLSRVA
jgi:hypothetical protein